MDKTTKIIALVSLTLVSGAFITSKTTPSPNTSTNPAVAGVLAEINTDTSCSSLQTTFDRGDATQDRGFRLNGENIGLEYMNAADARMREIGCYSS